MSERDAFMLLIGFNCGALVMGAAMTVVCTVATYRLFMKGKLL